MVRSNRGERNSILADWETSANKFIPRIRIRCPMIMRICDVSWWRGQSLLYLMRSMEKNSLLSCSPATRRSVKSALLLLRCYCCLTEDKNDFNAMHVVKCCPEHRVLRPPLLPRLEFPHDIRSANSCLKKCVCLFHRCCLGGLIHLTKGMYMAQCTEPKTFKLFCYHDPLGRYWPN